MASFAFFLGHQPHLSRAEIRAVLSRTVGNYTPISELEHCSLINIDEPVDIPSLQKELGGTVKIAESLPYNPSQDQIAAYLESVFPDGKIQFSLSGVGAKKRALAIKKVLKAQGRSVRYIEPKNSATIAYNNLVDKQSDLMVLNNALWVTRAVQLFEDFKKRDYDRPASDDKSGMLPPKLARMMITLAGVDATKTIYDPFCGSGTVLVEALSLGYRHIVGSDISQKAVDDARENTAWFTKDNGLLATVTIEKHDIAKQIEFLEKESIDVVVSEPFMGAPLTGKESRGAIEKQAKDLMVLYAQGFAQLSRVLAPEATAIFIIPRFRHSDDWIAISSIKGLEIVGFEHIPFSEDDPFLLYHRPGQHVGREVWKFKKTS